MQIYPLQNYSFTPAFKSNTRYVTDKAGQVIYRNTTNFFRNDLDWNAFAEFVKNKYKDADKVNVICHACSDGSEPMSLAILLQEKLGHDAAKFFPITAKDLDSTVIYMANGNYINMDYSDFELINKYTNNKFSKYFSYPQRGLGIEDDYPVRIMPELKKQIKFSVADITEDIHNLPARNTILFCRNFWPYLENKSEIYRLAANLASRLKDNCTVVTGFYDNTVALPALLKQEGFKWVAPNVYETKPKPLYYRNYIDAHKNK